MRRPAARLLTGGLVGGATAGLLALAGPAHAVGLGYEFDTPAAGTTLDGSTGTTLQVSVTCPLGACLPNAASRETLTAVDPYGGTDPCRSVAIPLVLQDNRLVGSLDATQAYPAGCGGLAGRPAADGTWTLTLAGDSSATRTVTVSLPARAPAAPTVTPIDGGLRVTFPAPAEPDATAGLVTIDPGTPGQIQGQIPCDGSTPTCSDDVGLPAGAHTVTLATLRRSAPNGSILTGPSSPVTTATVAAPAATSPSATVTGAGIATAAAGGSAPASAGTARTVPSATTGKDALRGTLPTAPPAASFTGGLAPDLRVGALPPLAPAPSVAPLPADEGVDGPFQEKLDYGQASPGVTRSTVPGSASGVLTGATASTPIQTWGSVAGALLLALTAGHVRTWGKAAARAAQAAEGAFPAQGEAYPAGGAPSGEAVPAPRRWRARGAGGGASSG